MNIVFAAPVILQIHLLSQTAQFRKLIQECTGSLVLQSQTVVKLVRDPGSHLV